MSDKKSKLIAFRVSKGERDELDERAEEAGLRWRGKPHVSGYIRKKLFKRDEAQGAAGTARNAREDPTEALIETLTDEYLMGYDRGWRSGYKRRKREENA